jgi:serine/threonine protein kinase
MGSYRDDVHKVLDIYMPYLPLSLSDLLASPYFSPHHFPAQGSPDPLCEEQFDILSKSIMIQVLTALAFLHDQSRQIAHRDLKPQNIMFTKEGCVRLIDFGVSYQHDELDVDKTRDLWPEYAERLYFEVSTG